MDGGASRPPFMRAQSNQKRTFSTMAASHRDESSPVHDEHYENEHAARRRRFEAELRPARHRFPGDGLDFRRPVMSTSAATATASPAERDGGDDIDGRMNAPAVIDLTDDGGLQRWATLNRQEAVAASRSSSAREWPHLGSHNTVIDLEDSDDERDDREGYDTTNLPGASFLALPPRRVPSQHDVLRRSAHHRSPSASMDDIQFIEQRPLHPPRLSTSLPGSPRPQPTVTSYPPRHNDTIDLTEDDDEVVHLDTRQRDGVNLARPEVTAGVGTRSIADFGFQHMGQVVNLLREGGARIGGRLYRRVQDYAGPGAFEDFEEQPHPAPARHNGPPTVTRTQPAHRYHGHQHHHHHHAHQHFHRHLHRMGYPQNGAVRAVAQALGVQNDMAGLMDYHMTAFEMETGRANNRPPTPKYEPPSPAAEGFTRSPKEDEVVVCPNCGDELAMGDEGPKREVYVVKACGHAYCGGCAVNRQRPSSKKGKKGKAPASENDQHLPQPFSKCVVPGCGKPAGKTSMIHVYLGS